MLDWFRDRFAAGTPTKNINTVAPFLTLAYLYEEKPDSAWLPYLDEWAEWLMDGLPRTEENGFQHIVFNSENRQQLWDDTLMMSVLPLAKIGRLLGRPHYVEEARRQFMLHIKYLVDRKTGLWFHGWTFDGRHHFANALWARGNCWVTIAIPEFIELLDLPPGDGLREFLLETHLQQIRTLVKHQDARRPVAHAHRRSEVLSRSLGHRGLRLRHPEIRAQGLHRRASTTRPACAPCKAVLANIDATRRAQERFVRHAGVQRPGRLSQDSADLDALWPGHGHPRAGRVQARASPDGRTPRFSFGHYLAYGSNDFLGAGAMSIIGFWILFFYTTFCGLTRGAGRHHLRRPRACSTRSSRRSSATSPTTSTTPGSARSSAGAGSSSCSPIPLVPSFALMWVEGQSFWYYLITYCFFELVYAMEIIPYETLAAEMSPDYKTKAKFAGARIICGQIAEHRRAVAARRDHRAARRQGIRPTRSCTSA